MSTTKIQNKKIKKEIDKFQKSGNIQKAIDTCRGALALDENNAELHVKLGDLYMEWHLDIHQVKQYADEAITEYQIALETCVDSSEIYFKIAMAFYYKRELDKSINYFKLVLEHNTKMSEANFMLAEIFMRKGDFIEAVEYADKAIKSAPFSSSRAYFLKYCIQSLSDKTSRFQRAKNLIASFLSLPFDKYAMKEVGRNLSYLKFAPDIIKISIKILKDGFSDKIIDMYRELLDKAPGFVELYLCIGKVYYELKRYEDAICEYKMAIWLDSFNIAAYRHLCRAYEEQGDYNQAIEVYNKLIAMAPNIPDLYSNLANIYYIKGDFDSAISNYQTAITLNPNKNWTSVIAQTMGFVYQENKSDPDAAISAYQTAYVLTPEDIDIYVNLGSAFYDKEDYNNALAVYRQALELQPHNAKIHCNLGFLYWGKGDTEEAIKSYELAIKYNNKYDIAYNNLGVIYLDDLGRVNKAIELFRKAVETNPNYALAHFNLARAISIIGDKVEAAKLYQMAQDINKITQEIDPRDIADKISELFES